MQVVNNFMMLKQKRKLYIICIILIVFIGILVHAKIRNFNTTKEDIYYIYLEGKRILSGENPYARILSGNLRENQKYATYFPLFYLLSYLSQFWGFKEYSNWLSFWRPIFLFFNLGIAVLLFHHFFKNKLLMLGFFSALFWLLNRWTLHVTKIAHIDFIPIFFLILSLMIFCKYKYVSLLLFSLSLALKQIAIFLIPLYLIWIWQSSETNKTREIFKACLLIFSIPLITSIPFIIWNAEGFFKSILFSTTRNPANHFGVPSLDVLIGNNIPNFVGIKAKLPMLFLMSLIFISTFKRNLNIYTGSMLIMYVFLDFNSVLFRQYFCWLTPLILLAVSDTVYYYRQQQCDTSKIQP